MVRASNAVVATLNGIFLLVGLGLIGGGIYYHVHAATTCQRALQNPLLIMGAITSFLSLLGLIGSCYKNNKVLGLYLLFMLFLIVGLTGFTTFLFLITNNSAGRAVSGQGLGDHRVGDYSHWLQNHFTKGKNWDVFRSCLVDARVCKAFDTSGFADQKNAKDFLKNNFSPIRAGCCKPPADCGFQYKNSTFWTPPKSGPASEDSDCTTWGNNPKELCYNCNSCKAGFLANVRKQWRTLAIFFICLLVFIIIVFSTGCRASSNNRYDRIHRSSHV